MDWAVKVLESRKILANAICIEDFNFKNKIFSKSFGELFWNFWGILWEFFGNSLGILWNLEFFGKNIRNFLITFWGCKSQPIKFEKYSGPWIKKCLDMMWRSRIKSTYILLEKLGQAMQCMYTQLWRQSAQFHASSRLF